MPDHPSLQELAAFLAAGRHGRPGPSTVVRHLLAGCDVCLTRLGTLDPKGQLPRPLRALRRSEPSLISGPELDYDRAFAAAEQTLSFFLDQGKPVIGPPGALLAELGLPGVGYDEAPAPARADRLAIPFLTRWLIEKSHSLRFTDPEEMLYWALMARLAAQGCSREAAGNEWRLADLRAEAEAQLSNALRVLGRVEEAEDCIQNAWRRLESGTGDPEIRAKVFGKTTSLLTLQKNFQLAVDLSFEVSRIYMDLGSRHRSARARISGALAMLYDGDPERATRELWQALSKLDPEEDPTLVLATRINLVRCYIDLGEPAKALSARQHLPRIPGHIEPMILLRMDWQEGLLLNALGDQAAAARTLGRVRRGYMERRLAREAIVVTRDLASAFAELGDDDRVSCLLEETADWIQRMSFGAETSRFFAELRRTSSMASS